MDFQGVRSVKVRVDRCLWAAAMRRARARHALARALRGETRRDGRPFDADAHLRSAERLEAEAAARAKELIGIGWS